MFGCRSATISPPMRNNSNNIKTKIESNQRICLKLILSALIPLMIGVFTIVTTVIQHKLSGEQRTQEKYESFLLRQQSERQADNLQKESVLVTYLNDVSNLLMLEDELKVFAQIRTKTLTSLRQFDAERKRYLLLFLCESELICPNPQQLNSSLLKIHEANFNGVQFNGTEDNKCSFIRIYLYNIYLSNSSFINCYISRSNFSRTTMNRAIFIKSLIIHTSFKFALMKETKFCHMKLAFVNFAGASLPQSDFTGTVWDNMTVDFTNANLTEAKLSKEQLENSTLYNCVLPNGTWGPIQTANLIVNGDLTKPCTSDDGQNLIDWSIPHGGQIHVFPNKNQNLTTELGKCYFRIVKLNNLTKAEYISQTINLEHFSRLISSDVALYKASVTFQCFGKEYITILLRFIDLNGLRYGNIYKEPVKGIPLQTLELTGIIRSDVAAVQILLTFINSKGNINTTFEGNDCRCYNVNFSITKE